MFSVTIMLKITLAKLTGPYEGLKIWNFIHYTSTVKADAS